MFKRDFLALTLRLIKIKSRVKHHLAESRIIMAPLRMEPHSKTLHFRKISSAFPIIDRSSHLMAPIKSYTLKNIPSKLFAIVAMR